MTNDTPVLYLTAAAASRWGGGAVGTPVEKCAQSANISWLRVHTWRRSACITADLGRPSQSQLWLQVNRLLPSLSATFAHAHGTRRPREEERLSAIICDQKRNDIDSELRVSLRSTVRVYFHHYLNKTINNDCIFERPKTLLNRDSLFNFKYIF